MFRDHLNRIIQRKDLSQSEMADMMNTVHRQRYRGPDRCNDGGPGHQRGNL